MLEELKRLQRPVLLERNVPAAPRMIPTALPWPIGLRIVSDMRGF